MTASKLTLQEEKFLSRVAIKMIAGLSLEDAGRAVLADDRRIYTEYLSANSYDRANFAHRMARNVFAIVHARAALMQA